VDRPNLIEEARSQLTRVELLSLRVAQKSFDEGRFADAICWLQKHIGRRWIDLATYRLRHLHHWERFPKLAANESCILVCNHRSFFDLYVVTVQLLQCGVQQRIVYPVRANFFYDSVAGTIVNGAMSFFAMYPPMFRDRSRSQLNMMGLDELSWLLQKGGFMVGFHPEGTRNKADPHQLLPARTGIGRLVHKARVAVVPVFTNGLLPDDLPRQIRSNFDGTGIPIHTVLGEPIDFGGLLDQPASQGVYKRIANKTRDALMQLGHEEALIRAEHG
jgi:1-acyl-sn-glycerol-3-phosphate acyltransferase